MSDYLLQKLTIVIFSYNRHKYLKRTIKYWSKYQAKILVLDGSDTGFEKGARVVSNGHHAEVVRVPRNLVASIPDEVDDER